ncbi:MAG: hypothetical protein LBV19_02850 [Streptococcaceae bacterium]|jgi:hypothetical protein|nr:hypothetical protein [Streptococcaceae bacterium]
MELQLKIIDETGQIKLGKNNDESLVESMESKGEDLVYLSTQFFNFQNGDAIVLNLAEKGQYVWIRFDETLNESLVYIKEQEITYHPSLTMNGRESISDVAFMGKRHYIQARIAKDYEIKAYRNLALNPHDQKDFTGAYPHAFANVETRDDSTFFARNVIDGIFANRLHGSYPYQSWGINRQENATLSIDFGRQVLLNRIGFTLRSDFPHDSFWTRITAEFSNGETITFSTVQSSAPQYFDFEPIKTDRVTIKNLIKNEDDSPFPALTQLEAFGIVKEKN